MSGRISRIGLRAVARILPRWFRASASSEFETAAHACVARERARFGRLGVPWAWWCIVLDTVISSIALRREARVSRRQAASGSHGHAGGSTMEQLTLDTRRAWRACWRQRGFTAVAIITIALGLGANTAVFSVVYGVLWRPLPYPEAGRLHRIASRFPQQFQSPFPMSVPEFVEFRDRTRAYQDVGAYYIGEVTVGAETPERTQRALVTPELLPTLKVAPVLGRIFTPDDSRPGAADVVTLSWSAWQRLFAGDPDVVGQQVRINDVPHAIVGVMPAGFDLLDRRVDILQPLTVDPATFPGSRAEHYVFLIGRLAPDVTEAQARADADRLQREGDLLPAAEHVLNSGHHPIHIEPLGAQLVADVRGPLLLLQGAVLLVLLVACANLANLFLARADTRLREYAVRTALGASRRQLFRQMLAEGLLIGALGAGAGVLLAQAGLSTLLAVNPDAVPRAGEIRLDRAVLMFTLVVAVLTAVVMAVVPFARLRSPALATMVSRSESRGVAGGPARWRSLLVVAEVALAVLLVSGAGLLLRSVWNLTHVDVGFDRARLTTFSVVLPGASYDAARRSAFFADLRRRLRVIPGVEAVGSMSGLPPLRSMNVSDTDFEHIPNDRPHGEPPIENVDYFQTVSVGYIEAMGIGVARGRVFDERDTTGEPTVIINAQLASQFFGERNPLGARLKPPFGGFTLPWFTVVGVLEDVKQGGVAASSGTELYMLDDQITRLAGQSPSQQHLVVRSGRSTAALAPTLREAVMAIDPTLPVVGLRSMDDVIAGSVSEPRFLSMLLSIFAMVTLALAAIGTYGVMAYLVTERRREFGIRLALGADRGRILRLVVGRGLLLMFAGLGIGLAGAMAMGRLASTMLFGVSAFDPVTITGVAVLILSVGVAACLLPAWRATRVDPLITLAEIR